MKVKELIELLKGYNMEADVSVLNGNWAENFTIQHNDGKAKSTSENVYFEIKN